MHELEMAEKLSQHDEQLRSVTPEAYKRLIKEQAEILNNDPRQALAELPKMVRLIKDRKRLFNIAQTIVSSGGNTPGEKEQAMLTDIRKALRLGK